MLRVAVAGVRAHALRTLLTAAAVMLAVGLFGGSIVYGDTARAAFFDDLARGVAGVDLVATPNSSDSVAGARGEAAASVVRRLPGVAHAEARTFVHLGLLDRRGRVLTNAGAPGWAVTVPTWDGFALLRTVAGTRPSRDTEVMVDEHTAAREGFAVGKPVTVIDASGKSRPMTLVGLVDVGANPMLVDTSTVALTPSALRALGFSDDNADIIISASGDRYGQVSNALGPGWRLQTGDTLRREAATTAAKYVESFLTILRVTGLVALIVSCLVVYNTFQILVAQRTRQLALLRCIGARRTQLVALVVTESAAVGLVASVGSAMLSVVMGQALIIGKSTLGDGRLPETHLVVSPAAILLPLIAGVVVTVACGLLPAYAAGRVSPVAALAAAQSPTGPIAPRSGAKLTTAALACVLALLGFAVIASGRGRGFDGLVAMALGSMVVFVALVAVMPLLAPLLLRPIRALLGRLFGPTGGVAVANAGRHPMRFAATTTALMIGIAPLTTFAIILTTAQTQAQRELTENFPVDYVVSHVDVGTGPAAFAPDVLARLRSTPELGGVTLSQFASTEADGCCTTVVAAEPGSTLIPEVIRGDLGGLPPGTAAVRHTFASWHGLDLGTTITVGQPGRTWPARLVAIFDDSPYEGDVLVNWSDFAAHLQGEQQVLVGRADGASADAAAQALDAALAGDALAQVSSTAQRHDSLTDTLGRRLVHLDALLGMSLVIAMLGIANTLSLAVLERRRESATLRALGLGRRQLYGMFLIEAMVTAAIGALIGVVFGLGFGWFTAHELIAAYGHGTPDIPFRSILLYVSFAALAGAIASVLPARQAARAPIVTAMSDT